MLQLHQGLAWFKPAEAPKATFKKPVSRACDRSGGAYGILKGTWMGGKHRDPIASFTKSKILDSRESGLAAARFASSLFWALAGAPSKGHYRTCLSLGGRLLVKHFTANLPRTGGWRVMALLAASQVDEACLFLAKLAS